MAKTAKKYEVQFGIPVKTMGPDDSEVDLNKQELYEHNKTALEIMIEKAGGSLACEVKEDGYRCQSHVDTAGKNKRNVRLFSRGLEPFELRCFPEINEALIYLRLKETILDGELKGLRQGLQGFKAMQTRARYEGKITEKKIRQYLDENLVEEFPLELVLFDILMLNGKSCLEMPYTERRQIVEEIAIAKHPFIKKSEQHMLFTPEGIMELYDDKVNKDNAEGLVVKQPNLIYIPGDKKNWIKLKKFENLDLVVVGLYNKKTEKFGTNYRKVLLASYNPSQGRYETVGTANVVKENPETGDKFGNDIEAKVKNALVDQTPANVVMGANKAKYPDVYVIPEKSVVVEATFMNIDSNKNGSYGCSFKGAPYSLRTTQLEKLREDKTPQQASSPEQIARMYFKRK